MIRPPRAKWLVWCLAAACVAAVFGFSPPAPAADGKALRRAALLAGPDSPVSDVSLFAVNTPGEWREAVATCFGPNKLRAALACYDDAGEALRDKGGDTDAFDRMEPPVDLADHTALLIFAGKCPSSAPSVVVGPVVERVDAVVVHYEVALVEEMSRAGAPPRFSPFAIVFVAKTAKPVEFRSGGKAVATVGGASGGEVVNGIQLLLDVKPAAWKTGDKIEFACAVKNVTGKPWRIFGWGLGSGGALEVRDAAGSAVQPRHMRDGSRALTDADCPFLREPKRFTLGGRIQKDGTLLVNEPQGGEVTWALAAGSLVIRATLGVEQKDWTLPMEQVELRWTGKVRSNAVKVTVASGPEGPAKAEPARRNGHVPPLR